MDGKHLQALQAEFWDWSKVNGIKCFVSAVSFMHDQEINSSCMISWFHALLTFPAVTEFTFPSLRLCVSSSCSPTCFFALHEVTVRTQLVYAFLCHGGCGLNSGEDLQWRCFCEMWACEHWANSKNCSWYLSLLWLFPVTESFSDK